MVVPAVAAGRPDGVPVSPVSPSVVFRRLAPRRGLFSEKGRTMGRLLLRDFRPDIAAQLVDGSLASSLSYRNGRKVRWRCSYGHEWEATVASRTNGSGCPYCSGRYRIAGVNDLATTHPDLAAQLVDQSLGAELSSGSTRRVTWRCGFGHEWEASVMSRTQGRGCPVCSNRVVVPGVNDLATTHPEVAAMLVDAKQGRSVTCGSTRRLRWRCGSGHEWEARVSHVAIDGHGCPYCGNRRVLVGFNDLATTHPDVARQLVEPSVGLEVTFGSNRRVGWRCGDCGYVWRASVRSRTTSGSGCPTCAGRAHGLLDDYALRHVGSDMVLGTARPDLASELVDGSLAGRLFVRGGRLVMWRCAHGHEWRARVVDRVDGAGCPYCATIGSDVRVGISA